MPIPIQEGSVTTQLREFFRLRGRLKFWMDETIVPIVQLKDLNPALGQVPGSSGLVWTNPAAGSGQAALLLNPDAATLQIQLAEVPFEGRTYASDQTELTNRSSTFLGDALVHIVSRSNVLAPGQPTSMVQLTQTEENATGLERIPVVMAEYAAGGIAFSAAQLIAEFDIGTVNTQQARRLLPPFTIGPDEAVLVTIVTAGAASLFMNSFGSYSPQPR